MKKIIIMIPVFNDWDSLKKLIYEINHCVENFSNFSFDCIVINDASTINQPKIEKPKNFTSLKIFNMKINKGHARCNAFGINYINKNLKFDNIILMDGDGEDRPIEIKSLINEIKKNPENSIVAKRIKRSEGPFFRFLYIIHKLITLIFTGKKINFGNYSCLTKKDAQTISDKASLWSSYSGTVKKFLNNLGEIDSIRGERYFGPSKMSLYRLVLHSFSIIAVFKYRALITSILVVLALYYFNSYLGLFSFFFQTGVVLFILLIFLVSLREKKQELLNCQENLKNIEEIKH